MTIFSNMISVLFIILFVTFAQSTHPPPTPAPATAEQQRQLSDAISHFSRNFYKATADLNPGQNLIMSPLSAQMALALLSLGAEGDTLAELNRALYLPSKNFTKAAFKPAVEQLNAVEGVTLNIANKVFVKKGKKYPLSARFKKDADYVFQSEVENISFVKSARAAHTINSWVKKKTNDKIENFISPVSLGNSTRLVLVNAIYFKGAWDKVFSESSTARRNFFVTATEKTKVDLMHNTAYFGYGAFAEWDAQMLEMLYEDMEMSMLIILPNKMDGLAALEEKLAAEDADIQGHMKKLLTKEVNVAIPKFKIETTIDLTAVLPKIGVTKIFNPGAQLGGLLDSKKKLVVSRALQKAFIEVNEWGSEAAAAGIEYVQGEGAGPPSKPPISFRADHPFYYTLLYKGDALFAGRYVGGD